MLIPILFLYIYFFVGIVKNFPLLLSQPQNELVFSLTIKRKIPQKAKINYSKNPYLDDKEF